jgi:hypothetical protein
VSREYLGPFGNELTLEVGTFQKMVFASTDVRPYWMSPTEGESSRNNHITGKKIKRFRNKNDLLKDLQAKGGVSAKGTKDELQVLCKNKDLPIKYSNIDPYKMYSLSIVLYATTLKR